jgi:hypothetical protein
LKAPGFNSCTCNVISWFPSLCFQICNVHRYTVRENNTGRFPRGLSLMLRSLSAWLYDGDPIEPLRFEQPLAQLKERMATEARRAHSP